ncbi:hypothetical protein [Pontibacter akesuensis]|uniref:Uncharacterized protein n=1 Tax=Pontibacter akesuensis TaxID=388950 RepID=A0A1I7KQV8_9BACT|nr:hypothetical protein [Pontibacter akesuensis]GHA81304.1 hypothetical protein GCM10007389_39780 [Pontibacter akesuensis]SFU99766.1 hypothetical protein SAMN04487941_4000 [Pontibacter akesuensis]
MKDFQERILPLLRGGQIRYLDGGVAKSMSADYFADSFRRVATAGDPDALLYRSIEHPDFVMRFRLSEAEGLSAALLRHAEPSAQLEAA